MRVHWIVALATAVAGFGLGMLLGVERDRLPQQTPAALEDALEAALALPPGVERTARYVAILGDLDAPRAEAVAAVLERDLRRPTQYEVRLFTGAWAEFAPETALARALDWDDRTARLTGSGEALEIWARNNPAAAREALSELGDDLGELRGSLSAALAIGWIDSGVDPAGLAPYIAQLEDWDRERATRELINKLAVEQGYEVAMAWAEAIPDDAPFGFRNLAFRKISLVIGARDPERVARWLEPHREHRYGQAGFRILGRTWAGHDPQAAIAWAMNQPDDRARFLAVKFAFERWYDDEREAAQAWLAAMPDDGVADPAHLMVALLEEPRDPALAAAAALRIRDKDLRLDTFGKVLWPWLQREPPVAARWLQESELGEPERALVARMLARMSPGHPSRAPARAADEGKQP